MRGARVVGESRQVSEHAHSQPGYLSALKTLVTKIQREEAAERQRQREAKKIVPLRLWTRGARVRTAGTR